MTASYLTLAEYSQYLMQNGKPLSSGIVDVLRRSSMILDLLQFPTLDALKATGTRTNTLPTPQNRKLNVGYTHSVGSITPLEENAYLFGGRVQWDHQLEGGSGVLVDPAQKAIKDYSTAIAYAWNSDFINNTPADNVDSIVGLRYRMRRDFSGQIVDGSAVDISPDSATAAASAAVYYDKVQAAIYSCAEHSCDLMLCSSTTKLRIDAVARILGMYATAQDSFGRTITTWGVGGPKIADMGFKINSTTKVMPDTETSAGLETGGALSSILFAKLGVEYLTGWQKSPMQTFEWQQGVLKYAEIDWAAGIFITDPRSLAWLVDLTVA
jgi:hypothetical protein